MQPHEFCVLKLGPVFNIFLCNSILYNSIIFSRIQLSYLLMYAVL